MAIMERPFKSDREIEQDLLLSIQSKAEKGNLRRDDVYLLLDYVIHLKREQDALRKQLTATVEQFQKHIQKDKEQKIRSMQERSAMIANQMRSVFGLSMEASDDSSLKELKGMLKDYVDKDEDATSLVRSIRECE